VKQHRKTTNLMNKHRETITIKHSQTKPTNKKLKSLNNNEKQLTTIINYDYHIRNNKKTIKTLKRTTNNINDSKLWKQVTSTNKATKHLKTEQNQ
jgi:hypothetical protein